MFQNRDGFTMLELVIVVVIVGILATIGLVQYGSYRENALDKDAIANLKLIRSAERIYFMESSTYYPSSGSVDTISSINDNLRLDITNSTTRKWNYQVWSTGCARATRNVDGGRSYSLAINDTDGEPDLAAGCP